MVAREFITGKKIRLWRHQLYSLSKAPFDTGPNSLFVAYSAGAEISCFIALHWSIPLNILDLYTEYLAFTNGRRDKKSGTSLLCAMEHYRLGHLTPAEKDAMRALAMRSGPWTRQETASLLDYCAEDVDALCRLLPPMAAELALRPAPEWLFRGRAMAAMQCIEMNGIPLDAPMLEEICTRRLDIIARLTGQLEARYGYGIWQGTHWRHGAFREWTRKVGLKWPSTSSGLPTTDDRTFRRMILSHPRIPLQPLHECRRSVELLSKFEIAVDADGRSRCWLAPFRSESGRNQPSNSRFVFGAPSWLRDRGYLPQLSDPPWSRACWGQQGDAPRTQGALQGRDARNQLRADRVRAGAHPRHRPRGGARAAPRPRPRLSALQRVEAEHRQCFGASDNLLHEAGLAVVVRALQEQAHGDEPSGAVERLRHDAAGRGGRGRGWHRGVCAGARRVPDCSAGGAAGRGCRANDRNHAQGGRANMRHPVRAACETVVRWPDRFIPDRGQKTWVRVQEILHEIGKTGEGGELYATT